MEREQAGPRHLTTENRVVVVVVIVIMVNRDQLLFSEVDLVDSLSNYCRR